MFSEVYPESEVRCPLWGYHLVQERDGPSSAVDLVGSGLVLPPKPGQAFLPLLLVSDH